MEMEPNLNLNQTSFKFFVKITRIEVLESKKSISGLD